MNQNLKAKCRLGWGRYLPLIVSIELAIQLVPNYLPAQEIDLSEHRSAIRKQWDENGGKSLSDRIFSTKRLQELGPRTMREKGRSQQQNEEFNVYMPPEVDPNAPSIFFPTHDMLRRWDLLNTKESMRYLIESKRSGRGNYWKYICDSSRNRIIATSTYENKADTSEIVVFDLNTGERVQVIKIHEQIQVVDWALSPDGNKLVCLIDGSPDRVEVFDLAKGKVERRLDLADNENHEPLSHISRSMQFLDDQHLVYLREGSSSLSLMIRDVATDQVVMERQLPGSSGGAIAIDIEKQLIACVLTHVGDNDNDSLLLFDATTLNEIRRLTFPRGNSYYSPRRICFSAENDLILVSIRGWSSVKSVLLNLNSGECLAAFPVESATFVNGTEFIVGVNEDNRTMELWSTKGEPVAELIPMSAERHWAIKTNAGFFDASPLTLKFMKENTEKLTIERGVDFIEQYYRPNSVRLEHFPFTCS